MSTLRGESVDRPPVCFYEINGLTEDPDKPDPFNIYSHPSWRPMLELTRDRTDRIVMTGVGRKEAPPDPLAEITERESRMEESSYFTTRRINVGGRVLTERTRRDADVNTTWTLEHLLKDVDDLKAFLELPVADCVGVPDPTELLTREEALGDTGIVLIDTADPMCRAAALFDMAVYTVIALTEPVLFRRLLDRLAAELQPWTETVAEALPGRLWRIYGPEYASPPYLPPRLFEEFVCTYDEPMVRAIQKHGGYARIHSHGRLRLILDHIAGMQPAGLDPIEPPPQGDMQLHEVRERCGGDMVLFGNLEISDIENLPTDQYEEKVKRALDEGTAGEGRGFVLMPSACPYGRVLSPLTLRNYERTVELVEAF